jgi:hypothetical protein
VKSAELQTALNPPLSRIILTIPPSDSLKELHTFLSGERFPLSGDQSSKRNVHDPNTVQGKYSIP